MNIETTPLKKKSLGHEDLSMDDFDFKPLTSGLGFHQPSAEIKTAFTDRNFSQPANSGITTIKKDQTIYQNDLSLFYNRQPQTEPQVDFKTEKNYHLATKPQRFFAYLTDLAFIFSIVCMVLTVMARMISMDLMELMNSYPNEILPMILTLFTGFYLIYFSIFEKAAQSTIGKILFNLRVVNEKNELLDFGSLVLRSFITLTNFISLGLFSYFDLQNKITHSKVIRID